jgi:SSS family solute:Na+ symporter
MAANFWRAWWAWVICFGVTILVSLFTRKKPPTELVGLVKGLTAEKAVESVPFIKTPEFYGMLSILVLIALNIYFW